MKKLVDSSYLPLDVLHKIRDDRQLMEFSQMLPRWFQRRVLEIKQVYNVNGVDHDEKNEHTSGIYARVFLDDSHQMVICVHKHHLRFVDIQVAVRTYKYLKAIIKDLKIHTQISIINMMEFCVDLPGEFFDNCPKWTETDIRKIMSQELDEGSYYIDYYRGCYGIACKKRYSPNVWDFTIFPKDMTTETLSYIKTVRPRIDSLMSVLYKYDCHIFTDVAMGVLPLDEKEMKQYKKQFSDMKTKVDAHADDVFDLDKIPMETLDRGYVSYRQYRENENDNDK